MTEIALAVFRINYNMRCIETSTIDTLRFPNPKINYNMRCIETLISARLFIADNRINYNMRCIETRSNKGSFDFEMVDKLQHEMY